MELSFHYMLMTNHLVLQKKIDEFIKSRRTDTWAAESA